MFKFECLYQSKRSAARIGRIHTPHGVIDTPHFVPVATQGTLKAIDSMHASHLDMQLVFCNTYHLMLHPGAEVIAAAGGIHTFMGRSQPIITDSGGFQIFSLAYGGVTQELKSKGTKQQHGSVLKITEEGVLFRSYRDGSKVLLTPERSIEAQKMIGADIIIPLDELPPYHFDQYALHRSLERTHRWEARSLAAHRSDQRGQAIYGVIHGGIDPVLRSISAQYLTTLPFDGFAIGGSLGKDHAEMERMLTMLCPQLPMHMPRHLLGMGDVRSLDIGIPLGIDTFDSAYPTRCARHGTLLTSRGVVKITKGIYRTVHTAIDPECTCMVCVRHTAAYLHHLFKAYEPTAYTLASIHNIQYMLTLFSRYRTAIAEDRL